MQNKLSLKNRVVGFVAFLAFTGFANAQSANASNTPASSTQMPVGELSSRQVGNIQEICLCANKGGIWENGNCQRLPSSTLGNTPSQEQRH